MEGLIIGVLSERGIEVVRISELEGGGYSARLADYGHSFIGDGETLGEALIDLGLFMWRGMSEEV